LLSAWTPPPAPAEFQHTTKACDDNFLTNIGCAIGSGVGAIFDGIGGLFTPDPQPPPNDGAPTSPAPGGPSEVGDYVPYSTPAAPDYNPPSDDLQSPTLIQYEPPAFLVPDPPPPPAPQAILIYSSPPPPPPPVVALPPPTPPPDAPPPTPLAILVPLPNKPATFLGFNFSLLGEHARACACPVLRCSNAGRLLFGKGFLARRGWRR
jgi:hypothetical protein